MDPRRIEILRAMIWAIAADARTLRALTRRGLTVDGGRAVIHQAAIRLVESDNDRLLGFARQLEEHLAADADPAAGVAKLLSAPQPPLPLRQAAGYFLATAMNLDRDRSRREATRRETPLVEEPAARPGEVGGGAGRMEDWELSELLRRAMRVLPQAERDVLTLRIAGHSHAEIASKLKTTPEAARQRLRRARVALAEFLARELRDRGSS